MSCDYCGPRGRIGIGKEGGKVCFCCGTIKPSPQEERRRFYMKLYDLKRSGRKDKLISRTRRASPEADSAPAVPTPLMEATGK